MVKTLLNRLFNGIQNGQDFNSAILQYAMNDTCPREKVLNFENRNCQTTIWTHKQYELSIYLLQTILKEDDMNNDDENRSISILKFRESLPIQFIKLICCFMKRSSPEWYRKQNDLNRFMWRIFKDKNNNFGTGSRLYACKALLIQCQYFGESKQYKSMDDNLRLLLTKYLNDCHQYFELLQSILCEYMRQQIKYHKKNQDLSKWLNKYSTYYLYQP